MNTERIKDLGIAGLVLGYVSILGGTVMAGKSIVEHSKHMVYHASGTPH